MVTGNRTGDGQSEPDAARVAISRGLKAHEGIKDPFPIAFRNARTIVLDKNLNTFT
jgi:hypothetical protein